MGKPILAFGLRLLNVLILPVFQGRPYASYHDGEQCIAVERLVYGAYITVVFLLFLAWSLHRECRKLKRADVRTCGSKCRLSRPPAVACGLSIRIITRELFAVLGPYPAIQYEYCAVYEEVWQQQFAFTFMLLLTSVGCYMLGLLNGTVMGTVLEFVNRRCIPYVKSCMHREQRGNDWEDVRPTHEDPEINRPVCIENEPYDDTANLMPKLQC